MLHQQTYDKSEAKIGLLHGRRRAQTPTRSGWDLFGDAEIMRESRRNNNVGLA
ncbi:MAG TPA: hypothetical protein VGS05_03280 [Candidatus Sulfotelmatobacter sp.]|nr:hypothetical protein [Candidatus Sulfotelmatobacter sp.]